MIYISLPVHTQSLVIANQCKNFERFFPESTVVLHVSAQARFELQQLEQAISREQCRNVLINPERLETAWGGILPAHVSNILFIRKRRDATKICLHASNDMLVRSGLHAWLRGKANVYHHRPVYPGSYWRFADAALHDEGLIRLCGKLGARIPIASQIEGSCYDAELSYEIARIIKEHAHTQPSMPYPREEIWLSTVANALRVKPDGSPYIFSELHRFDRAFWKVLRYLNPLIGTRSDLSHFIRRAVEYSMIKSGFHRINRLVIDRIGAGAYEKLAPYEFLSDGNNYWRVFDRHGLFGVKRVPRRIASPVRTYITQMAEHATTAREAENT